jgi:signal transduction histidine kinase
LTTLNEHPLVAGEASPELALIVEVGALAATSSADEALEAMARAALPHLGDACAIDVESELGELERRHVVHADRERERATGLAMREAFRGCQDHAAIHAWAMRETALEPAVTAASSATLGVDAGTVSAVVVPLLAHGDSFGALTFASHEPRRRHCRRDLLIARQIAVHMGSLVAARHLETLAEHARSEASRAIDRTQRLEAVTAALSNAVTCTEAADVITRQVIEGVGASSAAVAQLGSGDELAIIGARGVPEEYLSGIPLDASMPAIDALRDMEPVFIESIADREDRYPHLAALHVGTGNGAFAAIPLAGTRGVFGVLGLTFHEARRFEPEGRSFLMTLAYHCAQALERARLYDVEHAARVVAETAQRRAEFFAAVGQMLSGSLDEQGMASGVAQLTVEYVAAFCVVDLVDPTGRRHHAAIAHGDATDPRALERLAAITPGPNAGDPLGQVIRTGCEHPAHEADPDAWTGITEEERAIWRTLGTCWLACFPIIARGQTFGALLVGGAPEPEGSTAGASLGREVANQLAIALDRARLYGEARDAVKAREDMVAVVSHDLRTPLFVIGTGAELLLRQNKRSEADITSTAQATQRAVNRMTRLISDILSGEAVTTGRLHLEPRAHDVAALVEDAVEPYRVRASQQRLSLEVDVPPGTGPVACDRERVLQVLTNLLDNAFKFTRAGRIRVAAWQNDGSICFEVSDSGEGIEESALPRVFERYWRGSGSNRSGVGLGLTIVKGIVEAHGGSVSVESTRGVGTTFRFTLPAAGASA